MDLSAWGLAQAGFWNYLREDITVALECRRPLHINIPVDGPTPLIASKTDEAYSNVVSYLLAKVINFCFQPIKDNRMSRWGTEVQWHTLTAELENWDSDLPPSFEITSTACKPGNVFPSLWMLRPCHGNYHSFLSNISGSATPGLIILL